MRQCLEMYGEKSLEMTLTNYKNIMILRKGSGQKDGVIPLQVSTGMDVSTLMKTITPQR